MKTCALYGFIMSIAGALLILALYFAGFHSDPAKLPAAKMIGGILGLAIAVVVMVLGVRARRAEVPESEEFGYGRALGAGVVIALVNSVLGALFNYAYNAFINPGFTEIMVQDAMDKMRAKGVSDAQADAMEKGVRFMSSAGMQAVFGLVFGFIFLLIIALVVAAVLKRPAPTQAANAAAT